MAQLPEEENGRDSMLREVREGAGESAAGGDASNLTILARGCDPVMAAKSSEFLPKMLGNVKMIMTTDDEAFLAALKVSPPSRFPQPAPTHIKHARVTTLRAGWVATSTKGEIVHCIFTHASTLSSHGDLKFPMSVPSRSKRWT